MKKKLVLAFVAGWTCGDIHAAWKAGVIQRGGAMMQVVLQTGQLPMSWDEYIIYLRTGQLPPHLQNI